VQDETRTDQRAEERGVTGGAHKLEADVGADLAKGHLVEVGVEAETATVSPIIEGNRGVGKTIEVRGAELTVQSGLRMGCGKVAGYKKEQSEKGTVQAGATGRKSIHSGKCLYFKKGA
jgi:hypothetical protein